MSRLVLFLLLVVALPLGVYWAGNGLGGLERLPHEVRALRGPRPAPTRAPPPEEAPPAAEPEAEPAPGEDGEAPPPPPVEPPPPDARALFEAGRFAEAAEGYAGDDPRRRALAELGAAFVSAFPARPPPGRYEILETIDGDSYEGYVEERDGRIKLTTASGQSFGFPDSAIAVRNPLTAEDARDRIAQRTIVEGLAEGVTGPRLFALIQGACTAGRPDAAAPLLRRALELDERDPYFLSAVRNRAPAAAQRDLYLAFATCQSPSVMGGDEPVVARTPSRLGGRNGGKADPYAPKLRTAEARELLEKAAPYRKAGEKLYRRIVLEGIDSAQLADVKEAIASLDKAIGFYEKAVLAEDNDAIYALLRKCSKLNFNLRFWQQQLEGR